MKSHQEREEDNRRRALLEIKRILPYVEEVNSDLYRISASLRPDPDDDNQYAHWVYEIKTQLDFIASALTDEFGNRFGSVCQDGHIFKLLQLYEDSLQLPTKSIQEKMVLEFLIRVCTAIIVANGSGEPDSIRHTQADYALGNTRLFIDHLVQEHDRNNKCREKNVWFDLKMQNYINAQE